MTLFSLFPRRQGSAPRARERLQILLSHERSICGKSDLISVLQEEILTALGKHIIVSQDHITIRLDRGPTLSTLDIEVLIPHSSPMPVSSVDRDFVKTLRMARSIAESLAGVARRTSRYSTPVSSDVALLRAKFTPRESG